MASNSQQSFSKGIRTSQEKDYSKKSNKKNLKEIKESKKKRKGIKLPEIV